MSNIGRPRCKGEVTRYSPEEGATVSRRCIKRGHGPEQLCKGCAERRRNAGGDNG